MTPTHVVRYASKSKLYSTTVLIRMIGDNRKLFMVYNVSRETWEQGESARADWQTLKTVDQANV